MTKKKTLETKAPIVTNHLALSFDSYPREKKGKTKRPESWFK